MHDARDTAGWLTCPLSTPSTKDAYADPRFNKQVDIQTGKCNAFWEFLVWWQQTFCDGLLPTLKDD